jgi:hypothetical protein
MVPATPLSPSVVATRKSGGLFIAVPAARRPCVSLRLTAFATRWITSIPAWEAAMNATELLRRTIGDLARNQPRVVLALADLGISPRYLNWTLEAASRDLGINTDRVISRLRPLLA